MNVLITCFRKSKPVEVFNNNGLGDIIVRIKRETKSFVINMTTSNGRDELGKLAYVRQRSRSLLMNC